MQLFRCLFTGYNTAMSLYHITECSANEYAGACTKIAQLMPQSISFLQAPLYGRLQEKSGKQVVYFTIHQQKALYGCGLGIVYTAPGSLRFLYLPYGPSTLQWDDKLVRDLQAFFHLIARKFNCVFVRIDANEVSSLSVKKPIPDKMARTASLQPRAEWVLDITSPSDEIWMGLHKHARYNVRLAERAGAKTTLYQPSAAPLDIFYSLMQTTGSRDGFGIFDKSYYAAYLKTLADTEGFMIVTTIDGRPAASGLFVVYDKQAHYVFAGSSDDFRKIAPAYTVIWTAIQEAQKLGCTLFNFGGVTDVVKGQDLGGVTSFKKRFGGRQISHVNPIDFVYKPWRYCLFRLYKTFR